MSKSITVTCAYENTDFTRKYKFNDVTNENAVANTVRNKIKALNASLAGGTADGLDEFFRSDDYDSTLDVGKLQRISAAQIDSQTVTVIDLGTGTEGGE